MSSLPLRATGFWRLRSFVVGVLCADLGLHCCVSAPSRRSDYFTCVCGAVVLGCLRTAATVLWLSFGSLVVHFGFLGGIIVEI